VWRGSLPEGSLKGSVNINGLKVGYVFQSMLLWLNFFNMQGVWVGGLSDWGGRILFKWRPR